MKLWLHVNANITGQRNPYCKNRLNEMFQGINISKHNYVILSGKIHSSTDFSHSVHKAWVVYRESDTQVLKGHCGL